MPMFGFIFNVQPTSDNPDVLAIKRGFATVFVMADGIKNGEKKAVQRVQRDKLHILETEFAGEVTIEQFGASELAALFRIAQSTGISILKTFDSTNVRRN
jgi:hypothetical protein